MPGAARFTLVVAALGCAAALAGCGSDGIDGQLSESEAQTLNSDLAQVRAAVDSQNCSGAQTAAEAFVEHVNQLPAEAGEELKTGLRNAGLNLGDLVNDSCAATGGTGGGEEETTPDPTTETTEPTTPTTTTTTTTTDETETQPNGNGGGPPNGNGGPPNGNGNGGGPPSDGGQGGGTGGTGDETGGTGDEGTD